MSIRIMGIDQALKDHAGFGVIEVNDHLEEPVVLTTDLERYEGFVPGREYPERLVQFGMKVDSLYTTYQPQLVITEAVRTYHKGYVDIATIKLLSQAQGMMLAVVSRKRSKIYLVNTSSWKKVILGSGKASKEAGCIYIAERFEMLVSDHEADALCMCLYLAKVRMQEVENVLTRY